MSWDVVKLGDVISHRKGFITIDDEKPYKLCRVQLHRRGVLLREIIKGNQIKTKKQQICKDGDFLVAEMDAKVGGYGFIPPELDGAIVSSHYYLFELNTAKIKPKYLEVLSKLLIIQDQIKATGSTNYAAIRPQNVLDWEVPLPDIQTQERIADLYIKTSTGCDYLKSNYLLQLDLLKKLRQQILQDAVQGKLIPQDPNDEPASVLLERIKAEKEKLVREKKIKKEKTLPEIKPDEIPFKIPENWVWCRLNEIISILGDGLHGTPVFSKTGEYYFVNGNNLEDGVIEIKENTKRASEQEYQKYKKEMHLNTVLVSINGTLGKLGYYNNEKIILGKSACYFNLLNEVSKHYIGIFIKSPCFLKYAVDVASETTIKNVSLKSMRNLPIPLPSFHEQDKIIKKVEQLMTLCDELEQSMQQNQKFTQELLQVALREALEQKN